MLFNFPEGMAIRRLAAGLATSLSARPGESGGLDIDLSARLYLRRVPWSGTSRQPKQTNLMDDCTVGQYFAQFNFSGVPIPRSSSTDDADTEPHATTDYSVVRRYGA
ncbi:hypothetical protein GC173_14880 [bacterium]|nr:hypothetical protein [bacterium]